MNALVRNISLIEQFITPDIGSTLLLVIGYGFLNLVTTSTLGGATLTLKRSIYRKRVHEWLGDKPTKMKRCYIPVIVLYDCIDGTVYMVRDLGLGKGYYEV